MDSVFVTAHHCMYRSCASHMMVICHCCALVNPSLTIFFCHVFNIPHFDCVTTRYAEYLGREGRERREGGGRGERKGRGKGDGEE